MRGQRDDDDQDHVVGLVALALDDRPRSGVRDRRPGRPVAATVRPASESARRPARPRRRDRRREVHRSLPRARSAASAATAALNAAPRAA